MYTPSPRYCWALLVWCPLAIMRHSLSLWQHEHSGPMRTSRFLDMLIVDSVPHALVTDNHMCTKYLVTLIQIVPSYTDELWYSSETCVCRLNYIYIIYIYVCWNTILLSGQKIYNVHKSIMSIKTFKANEIQKSPLDKLLLWNWIKPSSYLLSLQHQHYWYININWYIIMAKPFMRTSDVRLCNICLE